MDAGGKFLGEPPERLVGMRRFALHGKNGNAFIYTTSVY